MIIYKGTIVAADISTKCMTIECSGGIGVSGVEMGKLVWIVPISNKDILMNSLSTKESEILRNRAIELEAEGK